MEVWDLYDESRNFFGKQHIRGEAIPDGEYHLVVEIFTVNKDGKLLLTQRDAAKTYSFLWECTGGSVIAGESSVIGAVRELEEETGLVANPQELYHIGTLKKNNHFLDSYIWRSKKNLELTDLKLQAGEVRSAKFVTLDECEQLNASQLIVPKVWERFMRYSEVINEWTR